MKKQNKLFTLFLGLAITLSAFGAEESYWQQFKNWVTGNYAQAQAITSVSYEWAKEFVAGLTPTQQAALKATLMALPTIAVVEKVKTGKLTAYGTLGGAVNTGVMVGLVEAYAMPHVEAYFALKNEVERIKKNLEGLSKEQKIAQLQKIRNNYSLEGNSPDELKLNAIDVILVELSKEK